MIANGLLQLAIFTALLALLAKPLGGYMARVYRGERTLLAPVVGPLERGLYRVAGVRPEAEMSWQRYALATQLCD